MNATTSYLDELQALLLQPTRSIIEIVDRLLSISLEHHLQIDWRENTLRVHQGDGDWEQLKVSIRKSIFRAILARLATLANESTPNSVSLYEGRGKVSVSDHPDLLIHFSFSNSLGDQWLELAAVSIPIDSFKPTSKEPHETKTDLIQTTA